MALFTKTGRRDYADPVPKPTVGDGPWGEAIVYWLNAKGWRQADLLKAIAAQGLDSSKNTVSGASRGFDCSTSTLRIIATALGVSLEDVLVSPARRDANQERRQMIIEAVEAALRGDTRRPQTDAEADAAWLTHARGTAEPVSQPVTRQVKPAKKRK